MKNKNVCSNEYESIYWKENLTICGIDEAGRGPIAGPLVVSGVILPINYTNEAIYDSKKISEKKRNELFDVIKDVALDYRVEIISEREVDEFNIYRATQMAMEKIASELDANVTLTDAMPLNHKHIKVIKGDQKSINIAAASILAKVSRDRIMCEYDKLYPDYGFKSHKGYPTKKHLEALEKYGVLDIHRKSYGPVKNKLKEKNQVKLF